MTIEIGDDGVGWFAESGRRLNLEGREHNITNTAGSERRAAAAL